MISTILQVLKQKNLTFQRSIKFGPFQYTLDEMKPNSISKDQLKSILKKADLNKDSKIDFDEFKHLVCSLKTFF
jgi:hypothetical protein